uniref:Protein zwilch n=1 Tax=Steinernema glaseri TaxID=37863 RepID=A0A1I8ASY5_9BILA
MFSALPVMKVDRTCGETSVLLWRVHMDRAGSLAFVIRYSDPIRFALMSPAGVTEMMLSRAALEQADEEQPLVYDKYRVRLLHADDVPVVKNISSMAGSDVLLVDLPTASIAENEVVKEEQMEGVVEDADANSSMDGVEYSGSPVKVSFLTMEKAEAAAGAGDFSYEFNFDITDGDGSVLLTNALGYAEAMTLRNRLYKDKCLLDKNLAALPVWIVANGGDSLRTVLVGFCRNQKNIATYSAKFLGFGSKTITALEKHHQGFVEKSSTKSVASCTYEIYRRESPREDDDPDRLSAFLSLNAQWTLRNNNEVLTAPVATAPVTIRFCPGWLDQRLVLLDRSKDIKLLVALSEALKCGKMEWPFMGIVEQSSVIVEEVAELIREEGRAKNVYKSVGRFIDFTEKLWDILKKCTTSHTLVTGLKEVFTALDRGQLDVALNNENSTTMARLLRSANTQNLILPRLEALMPYQILLEIGLERIKNDMYHDFMQSRMLNSLTDLAPFFKNTGQPETRVDSYIPIHLSLQFMLECQKILSVTDHRRFEITRAVVSRYCTSQAKTDMRVTPFETKVSLVDVKPEVLKGITPSIWSIETTCLQGKTAFAQSIAIFSRRTNIDFVTGEHDDLDSSTGTASVLELNTSNDSVLSRRRVVTPKLLIDDYNCTLVRAGIHSAPVFLQKTPN